MEATRHSPLDLQMLEKDLIDYCEKHAVEYSIEAIKSSLHHPSLSSFYDKDTYIQLRVNRKPERPRELNWRCEMLSFDKLTFPWQEWKDEASTPILGGTGYPFLIDSLCTTFPTASVGIDFDAKKGLVKLWHFGRNTVAETVEKVADLPSGVKDYLPFFTKYNMEYIYCTGVDYVNQSMNFYFAYLEEDIDIARAILKDLQFDTPSQEVLECAAQASAFAITFSLKSGHAERCCFYTATDAPTVKKAGGCMAEFVSEFQLPTRVTQVDRAKGFVGNSFGKNGHYNKLEFDYNQHYFDFLAELVEYSLSDN